MKITVEDLELRKQIIEYLEVNGTTVDDDTPVSITLPGAGATPQRCTSGSNLMTAGGKFAPGYDAKLKSALYAIIRGEVNKIPKELTPESEVATGVVGPMYIPIDEWTAEKATAVLEQFGWPEPTIKVKPEKKVKASENGDEAESEGEDGEAKQPTASTRASRKKAAAAAAEAAATEEASTEDVTVG